MCVNKHLDKHLPDFHRIQNHHRIYYLHIRKPKFSFYLQQLIKNCIEEMKNQHQIVNKFCFSKHTHLYL